MYSGLRTFQTQTLFEQVEHVLRNDIDIPAVALLVCKGASRYTVAYNVCGRLELQLLYNTPTRVEILGFFYDMLKKKKKKKKKKKNQQDCFESHEIGKRLKNQQIVPMK